MENVSRPLIAFLIGSVALFALWFIALKPSSSSSSSSPGAYQSAIAAAHNAVASSGAGGAAKAGTGGSTTSQPTSRSTAPAAAAAAHPVTIPKALSHRHVRRTPPVRLGRHLTAVQRLKLVTRALNHRRAIALLFYNPAGADDRAVKQELAAVPDHRGAVLKLTVPLRELQQYSVVTSQVTVNQSPTLVLIDRTHTASLIVGFADRFEIAQRVSDILATG